MAAKKRQVTTTVTTFVPTSILPAGPLSSVLVTTVETIISSTTQPESNGSAPKPSSNVPPPPASVFTSSTTTPLTTSTTTPTASQPTTSQQSPTQAVGLSAGLSTESTTSTASLTSSTGSSTISTSAPAPSSSSTSYGAGAVAGAAIGAAIGAALLAAVLVWFFMRRKNTYSRYDPTDPHEPQQLQTFEKSPILVTAGAASAASIVETHLPQPESDGEIQSELSKIDSLIEQHVENFYHTSPAPGAASIQTRPMPWLENNPDLSVGELKTLLANPKTRVNALRYAIGRTVTSHCEADSPPEATFLPPALPMVVRALSPNIIDDEVQSSFLSKYRQITTFLLRPTLPREIRSAASPITTSPSPSDPRYDAITRALTALDSILHPYAHQRTDDERRANLAVIFQRAAHFAFRIFALPYACRFDWSLPLGGSGSGSGSGSGIGARAGTGTRTGTGTYVVFPTLVALTDENGRRVRRGAERVFGMKRIGG